MTTTLQQDIKRNTKALEAQIASGAIPGGVAKHLKDTLWPLLSDIIDDIAEHRAETAEIAEDVAELTERTEDLLHEDTSNTLRSAIAMGIAFAAVLKPRLNPSIPEDVTLLDQLNAFDVLAQESMRILDDITIPDGEDGDAEEDDEDEGDGDEDDGGEA